MSVAFNNMPGVIRAPGNYAEVNAGISPYSGTSRTIHIGRFLSTGTVQAGKLIDLGSADPNKLFGAGSMLADQALFGRYFNPTGAVFALTVPDPASGAAAAGTFTVTGTATAAGTLTRYVAGERYDVPVANGDSAATIAANLATKVAAGYVKYNRRMLAPVTAAAASGVATLTARHIGLEGNAIRIEAGLDGDEVDPAGVTVAIAPMSGGTGTVDLAAVLATMGVQPGDWFSGPYAEVAHLNAARDFFSDSGAGRWSPTVELDGHYITLKDGNLSAQTALGATRNDRHVSVLSTNSYSSPSWSWVAALAGIIGLSKDLGRPLTEAIEIARPLQTITLPGLRGPADPTLQWGLADRESLYRNGLSAVTFTADGTPVIDRVLTTYQKAPAGVADITFLGIENMATATYVKRYIKSFHAKTYPRHVLRDDNPKGLQGVVTPAQSRATIVHAYTQLANEAGLVENVPVFARYLIVERSADPNRLNVYLPADIANQLIATAFNITIFPQFDEATIALQ